jgi:hypothetical protein
MACGLNGSGATRLCRVTVDHPGNNGRDPMTIAGAVLSWERPGDLATALDAAKSDLTIGPHSVSIGSARGLFGWRLHSLVEAGARVDSRPLSAILRRSSDDGVCAPQKVFQFSRADAEAFFAQPAAKSALAHAKDDLSIPASNQRS